MVRQQIVSISTSRSDPELEVHSVDDEKLSLKHGMPVKVKSTHTPPSHDVPSTSLQKINEDPKNSASEIDGVSVNGGNGKRNRCNDYGYDITDSEDCGDSKIDLGYHFTWSDEDEPTFLDQQGFGLNVYESIRAISKEASKKIDAVLAVDHVDQLQEELRKLRSEMKRRNTEFSDLKGIVNMKDHQIGTLELERDLYKADTTKLANDLETCLLKLRSIGGTSSTLPVVTKETEKDASDQLNPHEEEPAVDRPDPTTSTVPLNITLTAKSFDTRNANVPDINSFSPATGTDTASTVSNRSLTTTVVTPPRSASALPKMDHARPNHAESNRDRSIPDLINEVTRPQYLRQKVLMFALCRGRTSGKKKIDSSVQTKSAVTDSAILSQIIGKNVTVTTDNNHINPDQLYRPHGILHGQIQDMSQRLHSSITTSEDLRRRLAMLHLYYESSRNQLDSRHLNACVVERKSQFDLSPQQSEHQCHSAMANVKSKGHQQEQDMQSLRKLRVVTFNI